MKKKLLFKESVRGIVEYVLKTGSLDDRFVSRGRAIDGTIAHGKLQKDSLEATIKKIQDMMSDSYPKEHFGDEFKAIRQTVETILSDGANVSYLHSISNLALLNAGNNAALSNAAFDAKRNKIIELDKKGEFIPYCTKMVFLKYYTKSAGNQVHFWGQIDRESYVAAINSTLSSFLPEKIIMIGEVSQNG